MIGTGRLGLLVALVLSAPQERPATTAMAGVYSAEQARRGDALYRQYCSMCHGESAPAPRLVGEDFNKAWGTSTVGDLFDRIRQSMPENAPGSLTPQQNADVVAFLLSVNGFPAGASELPPDSVLLKRVSFGARTP